MARLSRFKCVDKCLHPLGPYLRPWCGQRMKYTRKIIIKSTDGSPQKERLFPLSPPKAFVSDGCPPMSVLFLCSRLMCGQLNMDVTHVFEGVPSSKTLLKYFNGFQWSQCDCGRLLRDVSTLSNLFGQLSNGKKQCVGFYCSPFLGLPALILGAAVSSCPFIFLSNEKGGINAHLALFEKLLVEWVVSDEFFSDANLLLQRKVEICGTELFMFKNVGKHSSGGLPAVTSDICNNYLYAVTTSGSTGVPKIVRVPVQSIFPNVRDFGHRMGVHSNDVILLSSALTFDPSMVEFFLAILNGASLVIISSDVKKNPTLLFEAIRDGDVTFYQTTPSLFRLWPTTAKQALLGPRSQLKILVLGGEPFPSKCEVKLWEPSDEIHIYNTYGITEVSCWATLKLVWPCTNWQNFFDGRVDIGETLSNTLLKTADDASSGLLHLFIGSSSRICAIEDETFTGFQGDPVFRATGDLFKMIGEKYYFCHRIDFSLKRLGKKFSVVLVEEKAKALDLNCAVVKSGSCDNCRIVMFVVGQQNSLELHNKLESLKSLLPGDHWPDHVEFTESLPLTAHGKINKAALLDVHSRRRSQSLSEKTFEELWSYFTLGPVAVLSNPNCKEKGFITSGGNSLNAVLFINSLKEQGFVMHEEDLLLMLLKDSSFNDCLVLLQEVLKGESTDDHGSKTRIYGGQSKGNRVTTTPALRLNTNTLTPLMALKGRVWPRSIPCLSEVWDQQTVQVHPEWKIDLKKCVDASPLVVVVNEERLDCLIIVGSHSGVVVVLDAFGEIKVKTQLPDRVEASACLSGDTNSFYIGCYDGKLYKIRIKNGRVEWEFATGGMVKCTAVVHENIIFFGSYDKHIYAVNEETGTLVWKHEVGSVTVPVIIHHSSIIVGTLSEKVMLLNSHDGQVFHSFHVGAPVFANLLMAPFDKVARCLLVCPVNGSLEWRNLDEAFTKVHTHNCPGTIFAAPVLVNTTDLIITSGTNLQYLQPPDCLWSRSFSQRIVATPFVVHRRLVVVTIDGELSVLNLSSGELLFSYRFPGEVFSSPVVVGKQIFVGCRDNFLHCLSVSQMPFK